MTVHIRSGLSELLSTRCVARRLAQVGVFYCGSCRWLLLCRASIQRRCHSGFIVERHVWLTCHTSIALGKLGFMTGNGDRMLSPAARLYGKLHVVYQSTWSQIAATLFTEVDCKSEIKSICEP